MSMFFLLLSKPHSGFTPIQATCAISGNADGLLGTHRSFKTVGELEAALESAGVSGLDSQIPLTTIQSGYATFIPISVAAAKKLEMLDGNLN